MQYGIRFFVVCKRRHIKNDIKLKFLRAEIFSKKERKIMMINEMKNYGALVNSISASMVDKARGILMDLPKTMPRPQYKSKTSGLMCYPVEEALQAWSLSVDDDRMLLAMAAVASMADYVDGVGIAMPVTADVMAVMKFVAHLLDAEESGPVYMRHEVYHGEERAFSYVVRII